MYQYLLSLIQTSSDDMAMNGNNDEDLLSEAEEDDLYIQNHHHQHHSGQHLSLIILLRKLCNHPNLILSINSTDPSYHPMVKSLQEQDFIQNYKKDTKLHEEGEKEYDVDDELKEKHYGFSSSGKMNVLMMLLKGWWNETQKLRERVVIVSNFTQISFFCLFFIFFS